MSQSSLSAGAARAAVLESLEPRRLFDGGLFEALGISTAADRSGGAVMSVGATPAAMATPTVTAARLSSGPGAAFLDAFIAADLVLPNPGHGVDASTLTVA